MSDQVVPDHRRRCDATRRKVGGYRKKLLLFVKVDPTPDLIGPGLALEVRMGVERQDHSDGQWRRTMRLGSREALVEEGADVELQYDAHDEVNMDADWEEGMRSVGTGVAPAHRPLIPDRFRLRFDYLSALGAKVTQVHIWETDRLHLPPDPWTWRLEEMTVDPGAGSGQPIVVRRPND
jgi:hypothetical protein